MIICEPKLNASGENCDWQQAAGGLCDGRASRSTIDRRGKTCEDCPISQECWDADELTDSYKQAVGIAIDNIDNHGGE